MIDERQEENASLYALDLLESAEQTAFKTALAVDPELQALVRELRESTAALAHLARPANPPPELRSRLLASIDARPDRSDDADRIVPFPKSNLVSLVPWAAAACLALATGWLALRNSARQAEASQLRDQEALTALTLRSTRNQLEAERILNQREISDLTQQATDAAQQLAAAHTQVADLSRKLKAQGDLANFKIAALTSMLKNTPEAIAVAVWNPATQEGVFNIDKLPPPDADHDYELWVISGDAPRPISAGVFKVGTGGSAHVQFRTESPIAAVAKFAVSREQKGGAPAQSGPKGDVIMISP